MRIVLKYTPSSIAEEFGETQPKETKQTPSGPLPRTTEPGQVVVCRDTTNPNGPHYPEFVTGVRKNDKGDVIDISTLPLEIIHKEISVRGGRAFLHIGNQLIVGDEDELRTMKSALLEEIFSEGQNGNKLFEALIQVRKHEPKIRQNTSQVFVKNPVLGYASRRIVDHALGQIDNIPHLTGFSIDEGRQGHGVSNIYAHTP
ncbi:MAG: hypothetical protein DHS20C02_15610 [Micavibrio sp.]|nr:MAG: hypothetical protein DHS20C02_15610 [Micavibrio sp.]